MPSTESSPQTAGNFLTIYRSVQIFRHSCFLFCGLLKKPFQGEHLGCDEEMKTEMPWWSQTLCPYVFSMEIIHIVYRGQSHLIYQLCGEIGDPSVLQYWFGHLCRSIGYKCNIPSDVTYWTAYIVLYMIWIM
jgi:hypothetical protein